MEFLRKLCCVNQDLVRAVTHGDTNTVSRITRTRRSSLIGHVNQIVDSTTGRTLLHLAALNGSVEIVKDLVAADAVVNAVDSDGWSALFYAIRKGRVEVVRYLVTEAGADLSIKSKQKRDALDFAVHRARVASGGSSGNGKDDEEGGGNTNATGGEESPAKIIINIIEKQLEKIEREQNSGDVGGNDPARRKERRRSSSDIVVPTMLNNPDTKSSSSSSVAADTTTGVVEVKKRSSLF